MRMSCNGCRVLRKGCSEDCIIRPCLQWLKSPDAQANATLFLAKFYGRAGLINLIEASPHNFRPGNYESYPTNRSQAAVDAWHRSQASTAAWDRCQAAVDAVLKGSPIVSQFPPPVYPLYARAPHVIPTAKTCKICHVSKEATDNSPNVDLSDRPRFDRPGELPVLNWINGSSDRFNQIPVTMVGIELEIHGGDTGSKSNRSSMESVFSVVTGEESPDQMVGPDRFSTFMNQTITGNINLDLTLGLDPIQLQD